MDKLLTIVYITGILYFVLGWFFKMRPPKGINPRYGYRTKRAKSSQQAWDFAQEYSTTGLKWAGLGLIGLGLIAPYLPGIGPSNLAIPFVGVFALLIIAPIVGTEIALRKRF